MIALMLVGSAALRFTAGPGPAVAEALANDAQENRSHAKPKANVQHDAPDRTKVGNLLAALQEREDRVAMREMQVEMRTKALAIAEEEIGKRLQKLEQTEANLRQTLALADGAAEKDLARLTAVYENMKPKDAAALFETMEPDFAAGFLGRMRPDAAAAVMAGLSPGAAYTISVILAGRNAKAPKS